MKHIAALARCSSTKGEDVASGRRVAIWSMFTIVVDIGLARLGYGLILPAIRGELSGSYAAFGAVATAYFVGYLVGSLFSPLVLRRDRSGRATATIAHVIVALGYFTSAFSTDVEQLGAARVVMGLACGVGIAAVISGAFERVSPSARAALSGFAFGGIGLALLVSAPATPWLLLAGHWRIGTLIAGAAALVVAAGVNLTFGLPIRSRPAERLSETPFQLRDLLAPGRYLLLSLAYFSFGAGYTAYSTFIVAALRGMHVSTLGLAGVWFILGVATIVGALTVGKLMSGSHSRWAFAISMVLAAFGCIVTTVPTFVAAVIGAIAVGLGLASSPGIGSALARARSSAQTGAAAFVAITAFLSVGQVVGPLFAGAAADRLGLAAVAWVAFGIYLLGAILGWADGALQSTVPREVTAR